MSSSPNNRSFIIRPKTPVNIWYKRGLNSRSLIQLSKILPIESIDRYIDFCDRESSQ